MSGTYPINVPSTLAAISSAANRAAERAVSKRKGQEEAEREAKRTRRCQACSDFVLLIWESLCAVVYFVLEEHVDASRRVRQYRGLGFHNELHQFDAPVIR